MDKNSIKKSVYAILAAESLWAFTSRMAWSPRFLSRDPIELGRGFFYAPTLMSRVMYMFPHIQNAVYTAQIYIAEPLQTYPSPGLCARRTVPFQPASSSGLVLYQQRTCIKLQ